MEEGGKSYRYEAFISYRHVDPDRRHAKWLHRALESYRPPRYLVKRGVAPRIRKVFRDEEELPASADLSSQITEALDQSRFLIVVCSPRVVESRWCAAEIERFRELGRHDRILALLVEGEPSESFPPALTVIRRVVEGAGGVSLEEVEAVEPLAADIRQGREESLRTLRSRARLRLAACLLGCSFDELRQRDLHRRQARAVAAVAVLSCLLLVLAALTSWALVMRQRAVAGEEQAQKARLAAEARSADTLVALAESVRSDGEPGLALDYLNSAYGIYRRQGISGLPVYLSLAENRARMPPALGSLGVAGKAVCIQVLPDQRLACGTSDGRVEFLNQGDLLPVDAPLPLFENHAVDFLAMNISGSHLVAASRSGGVRVVDLATREVTRAVDLASLTGVEELPGRVEVSSVDVDDGWVFVSTVDYSGDTEPVNGADANERSSYLTLFEVGDASGEMDVHEIGGTVYSVALAKSGVFLGAVDGSLVIPFGDGGEPYRLAGEIGTPGYPLVGWYQVQPATADLARGRVFSGTTHNVLEAWDLDGKSQVQSFRLGSRITALASSGEDALAGLANGRVLRFDAMGRRYYQSTEYHHAEGVVDITPLASMGLVTCTSDGHLHLWPEAELRQLTTVSVLESYLYPQLRSCRANGVVAVFGIMSESITVLPPDELSGHSLKFDHEVAAVATSDREVFVLLESGEVWRYAPEGRERKLLGSVELSDEADQFCLAACPEGDLVLVDGGQGPRLLRGGKGWVDVAVSGPGMVEVARLEDGDAFVVVGSGLRRIGLGDGKVRWEAPLPEGFDVVDVVLAGAYVLAGFPNGQIAVLDRETGRPIRTLSGDGELRGLSASPDGRFLLGAYHTPVLRIWSTDTLLQVGSFSGRYAQFVQACALEDRLVVSLFGDRDIHGPGDLLTLRFAPLEAQLSAVGEIEGGRSGVIRQVSTLVSQGAFSTALAVLEARGLGLEELPFGTARDLLLGLEAFARLFELAGSHWADDPGAAVFRSQLADSLELMRRCLGAGDFKAAGLMLERGFDPDMLDHGNYGRNLLYFAVEEEDREQIEFLLKAGARPDIKDVNEQSAADLAEATMGLDLNALQRELRE